MTQQMNKSEYQHYRLAVLRKLHNAASAVKYALAEELTPQLSKSLTNTIGAVLNQKYNILYELHQHKTEEKLTQARIIPFPRQRQEF